MKIKNLPKEAQLKRQLLQIDDQVTDVQTIQYDPIRNQKPQFNSIKVSQKLKTEEVHDRKKAFDQLRSMNSKTQLKEALRRLSEEQGNERYFSIDGEQKKSILRQQNHCKSNFYKQKSLEKMRPLILTESQIERDQKVMMHNEEEIIRSLIKKKINEKETKKDRVKENGRYLSNIKNVRKIMSMKQNENVLRKNFSEHKAWQKNLFLAKNRLKLPHLF